MANRGERPWDIGDWLRGLGLGQYEAGFRQNEVNESVLPKLTQEDLREIGVAPVGHRRMILDAIATLRVGTDAKAPPPHPGRCRQRRLLPLRRPKPLGSDGTSR